MFSAGQLWYSPAAAILTFGPAELAGDARRGQDDAIAADAGQNAIIEPQRIGDPARVQIVERERLLEQRVRVGEGVLPQADAEPAEILPPRAPPLHVDAGVQREHAVGAAEPLRRHVVVCRSVEVVERPVVRRNVERVGGQAEHHLGIAVADRARRMAHADHAGRAAVDPLEQEAGLDAEMLGQGGYVVRGQKEGGGGQTVDSRPGQARGTQRGIGRLEEQLMDSLWRALSVLRLADADYVDALEGMIAHP
jgi:hypothetical protein